jgi:hypothetical protein
VVLDRGGTENEGGSLNPNWILDQSCPRGATKELGREQFCMDESTRYKQRSKTRNIEFLLSERDPRVLGEMRR